MPYANTSPCGDEYDRMDWEADNYVGGCLPIIAVILLLIIVVAIV